MCKLSLPSYLTSPWTPRYIVLCKMTPTFHIQLLIIQIWWKPSLSQHTSVPKIPVNIHDLIHVYKEWDPSKRFSRILLYEYQTRRLRNINTVLGSRTRKPTNEHDLESVQIPPNLISFSLKIHFNDILPSRCQFLKWTFSIRFPCQNSTSSHPLSAPSKPHYQPTVTPVVSLP